MFAVGVDVSNARSTVAVLQSKTKVAVKPFEVQHTADGFAALARKLSELDGEARIVMEHTGRYYESFAMSIVLCFSRASIGVSRMSNIFLHFLITTRMC